MSKIVYAVEGLDRLGKSTLIEGIKQKLGFFQVIHFSKPKRLKKYEGALLPQGIVNADPQQYHYQAESFKNSMKLVRSGARLIFDRWHLGEAVYAPMYRNYNGDYVFDIEKLYEMDETNMVRLILLTENFDTSRHFTSDGESFDDTQREAEQDQFIRAFDKSIIRDKRIICVTARDGSFREPEEILMDAIYD